MHCILYFLTFVCSVIYQIRVGQRQTLKGILNERFSVIDEMSSRHFVFQEAS